MRPRTRRQGAVACLAVATLVAAGVLPAGLAPARAGWPDAPSLVESLVAAAHAASATDADRAALLAAEAYRLEPSARTQAALLSVLDAASLLSREVVLDDEVAAMASAVDTGAVLVATAGGDVVRWDLSGAPEPVGSVGGWVTELTASGAGTTVAALGADGSVHLLRDGASETTFTSALDVAVSPAGRWLAAIIEDDDGRRLVVQDLHAGADAAVLEHELDDTYDSVDLDDEFVVLSALDSRLGDQGGWERRSLPGLEVTRRGSVLPDSTYDADLAASAMVSPHGHWAASVHPTLTTVESTSDGERFTRPGTGAPLTLDVRTVVLSPAGTRYLVVRDQRNYLFDLTSETGNYWELQGAVAADAAAFADEDRVVTAQGRVLTLWDTNLPVPRTEIRETEVAALDRQAVAPGGRFLVAAGDEPGSDAVNLAVTYDLDDTPDAGAEVPAPIPARIGAAVERHGAEDTWLPVVTKDGTTLVVEAADGTVREARATASVSELSDAADELTGPEFEEIYTPPVRYETGLRDVLGARITSGGRLVLAAADGSVRVLDPRTGRVREEARLSGGPWTSAEVSPDGRHVAFGTGATVAVVDPATGRSEVQLLKFGDNGTTKAEPVLGFGKDELVVARSGGVAVLEADGSAVRAAADVPVPFGMRSIAVLPGTGIAVLAGDSSLAFLVSVTTGERIGELSTQVGRPSLTAEAGWLLAVGSDAGNRRVVRRDTSASGLLATACAVAGRDLSVEEWSWTVAAPPPSDLSCDRAW
ncbi:hypothetical protein [Promicromonospora sp. NPDC060271]|uniref:hypothetical protein n=1 Tax=Promicromonospora sp. NPDC060271 TaxID=3347089 RepID=UPI003646D518